MLHLILFQELFAPENGGRDGVNKVLILLTDGTQTQGKYKIKLFMY